MTFLGLLHRICDLGYDVNIKTGGGVITAEISAFWSPLRFLLVKDSNGDLGNVIYNAADDFCGPVEPTFACLKSRSGVRKVLNAIRLMLGAYPEESMNETLSVLATSLDRPSLHIKEVELPGGGYTAGQRLWSSFGFTSQANPFDLVGPRFEQIEIVCGDEVWVCSGAMIALAPNQRLRGEGQSLRYVVIFSSILRRTADPGPQRDIPANIP